MRRRRAAGAAAVAALGLAVAAGPAGRAEAQSGVRLHVRVETEGAPGQQVSRFWAFTTSDVAGTQPLRVSRLCVTGVGHQTQERCEDNATHVEVVERAEGLPGLGARCVEAMASAVWQTLPVTATARACP